MKNYILFSFFCFCLNFFFGQTSPPQAMAYQAIARNSNGDPIVNKYIGIFINILQGAINGTSTYTETHLVATNEFGMFTLEIGGGSSNQSFSSIPWHNGPYFLQIKMDPSAGSNYVTIGTQQLLSVPYALYSRTSFSAQNAPPVSLTITGSGVASVTPSSPSSSFNVFVPPPSLSILSSSNGIINHTLTQGNAISSASFDIFPAIKNNAWYLGGNANLTPSNYLGTSGPDTLIIKTNNTERIRVSPTGQTGIGNPALGSQLLDIGPGNFMLTARITNSLNNGTGLFLNHTHSLSPAPVFHCKHNNPSGTNALFEGGKVGIGILSPLAVLDITGNIPSSPVLRVSQQVSGQAAISASHNNTGTVINVVHNGTGRVAYFSNSTSNSSDAVVIDNNAGASGLVVNHHSDPQPAILSQCASSNTLAATALEIRNGHFKATHSGPLGISSSMMGCSNWTFTACTPAQVQGNDVRGTVTYQIAPNTTISATPAWVEIEINFMKPYTSPPSVFTSVFMDPPANFPMFSVFLTNINTTSFRIKVITSNPIPYVTVGPGSTNLKISYFVIE